MKTKIKTKTKVITRKCSECGCKFKQVVIIYDNQKPSAEDYDEFCDICNSKASR